MTRPDYIRPVADEPATCSVCGTWTQHLDTSTNNTQPKENQMIESSDEELAEAEADEEDLEEDLEETA